MEDQKINPEIQHLSQSPFHKYMTQDSYIPLESSKKYASKARESTNPPQKIKQAKPSKAPEVTQEHSETISPLLGVGIAVAIAALSYYSYVNPDLLDGVNRFRGKYAFLQLALVWLWGTPLSILAALASGLVLLVTFSKDSEELQKIKA